MKLATKLISLSAVIFLSRIAGAALMFIAQALIAKWLGAESLGEYLQATAAANIVGAILPLGFHTIAAYFTAEYASLNQGRTLRVFLKQTYLQSMVVGTVILAVGGIILQKFFPTNPAITANWPAICVFAAGIALTTISSNTLYALKRPMLGMGSDTLLRPLLIAASVGLLFLPMAMKFGVTDMLWFGGLGYFLASMAYVLISAGAVKKIPRDDNIPQGERARWWRYALPWTVIGLATDFFFDIDLLLLSGSLSYTEIAVFGVMSRLFSLASFGVSSVYLVSLPDVFAERAKNNQNFNTNLAKANLAAMAVAVSMVVGIAIAGPFALSFFGPDFSRGSWPLVTLSLSLAMRCAFGPAALMLSMNDKPFAALPSVAVGMVCLIIGNVVLVPHFGLLGAAASALIAMTIWSANMWYRTLKLTGTDISVFLPVISFMRTRRAA